MKTRSLLTTFIIVAFGYSAPLWAQQEVAEGVDLRYMSSEQLRDYYQQQAAKKRDAAKRQEDARRLIKRKSSSSTASSQNRQQKLQQRLQSILKGYESLGPQGQKKAQAIRNLLKIKSQKTRGASRSASKSNSAGNRPRVLLDAITRLDQNIPTEDRNIKDLQAFISHVSTFYNINHGANVRDLMKDAHFKELYGKMRGSSKKATFLYLKGVYENSTQAIKDQQEKNIKNVAELKLNRDFEPTLSDIAAFNEKSGIKSKLARSLRGEYKYTPPQTDKSESQKESKGTQ